jgi:uncharacterized protein
LKFVLDTFAVLAYLRDEPGSRRVQDVLANSRAEPVYLSWINLGEALYISERRGGTERARQVLALIEHLPIKLQQATRPRVLAAAHIKARFPVSYADAFAVAAAQEVGGTVLTGDPEFVAVEHLVRVEWLPR